MCFGGPSTKADNQDVTVTGQAGNPESVLSMFLDARLPQREVVAQAWARQAEAAPWSGVEIDPDYRRQLGNAIEIRIGLDVAATPGYWDVLSFLPPEESQALLRAAGYSADGREDLADTGTTDPLLLDWRRVSHPVAHGNDRQAVLAGCWDAAGIRDVAHGTDAAVQLRRSLLAHIREHVHRAGPLQGPVMTALVHLWNGCQQHGRRRMMALGDRVIIEPEFVSGFGKADLVIGRCLIDVEAVLSPAASFRRWHDQLLCYVLLDWPDIPGLDRPGPLPGMAGAIGPRAARQPAYRLSPRPHELGLLVQSSLGHMGFKSLEMHLGMQAPGLRERLRARQRLRASLSRPSRQVRQR